MRTQNTTTASEAKQMTSVAKNATHPVVAKSATTADAPQLILAQQLHDKVVIYQREKEPAITVKFDGESVWLNRLQIAELFGRDVKTIGKHVTNALSEELRGFSVVAKFATTATDGKTYQVEYYNLDLVLSVGYRVKSSEGIRFRSWANRILRDHLLKGYSFNRERLAQLNQTLEIISRSEIAEMSGMANVIKNYTAGLDLLDNYDHQSLPKPTGA